MIDKLTIERIRELPIEGVAERLGLQVSKHKSLCPFHQDSHPSLTYNVKKNSFKCFVCDAHGGVIDLTMRVLNKNFVEACEWLANEHNFILEQWQPAQKSTDNRHSTFQPEKYLRFFEYPYLNETACQFLYQERKLDPRVIKWCKLNSYRDKNGINWLQIPYFDIDGKLIGVQSRNLDYKHLSAADKEKFPRFRFPYGSKCPIYNLPVLKLLKPGDALYITEGASDCWAMLSSGHKAIAIPSATLLNKKDIATLQATIDRLTSENQSTIDTRQSTLTLHMYPDADIPGEKLYIQLVQLATQLGACLTRHSLPHGCKDFSDYYLTKF